MVKIKVRQIYNWTEVTGIYNWINQQLHLNNNNSELQLNDNLFKWPPLSIRLDAWIAIFSIFNGLSLYPCEKTTTVFSIYYHWDLLVKNGHCIFFHFLMLSSPVCNHDKCDLRFVGICNHHKCDLRFVRKRLIE